MSDTCVKHSFETAAGVCRQCRNSYCSECLVFAFGEDKPPYCVTCALNVAGVRHQGAKPNPRIRKRGLFGRKVLVDEEPRKEKSFDDIPIVLPEETLTSPAAARTTRREVAPEVIAMVQSAEAEYDPTRSTESGRLAVAVPPEESDDSLADWAASLGGSDDHARTHSFESTASFESTPSYESAPARSDDAWPESSSSDAWPDETLDRY